MLQNFQNVLITRLVVVRHTGEFYVDFLLLDGREDEVHEFRCLVIRRGEIVNIIQNILIFVHQAQDEQNSLC